MKTDKLSPTTARSVHMAVHEFLEAVSPDILARWRFSCLIVPVEAAPALRPFNATGAKPEPDVAALVVEVGDIVDALINPPEVRERQGFVVMAIPLDDEERRLALTNAADDDELADALDDLLATIKRGRVRNV